MRIFKTCVFALFSAYIFAGHSFADIPYGGEKLHITEAMGSNTIIFDETGATPDWIEIYNGSKNTINLKGHGLSDDPADLGKWVLPGKDIAPGEYLVVYASGKDKSDTSGSLHSNFKISSEDEGIYLSDPNKVLIDVIPINNTPHDISFGKNIQTGVFSYFSEPSPGKPNTYPPFSPRVQYSVNGGFYDSPIEVALHVGEENATIYYTDDGSTPTVASKIYSGPIKVSLNTTIRAISSKVGHLPSFPAGQTYFVGFDNKRMAVLSIATEEDKLWNPQRGLFRDVSYKDYMLRETVRVHVSYFDENGNMGFSQDAIMAVCGASSREVMMRPLKFSASSEIDPVNDRFRYKLLKKDIKEYRHFQIRNNNQDGVRYLTDPECMPTMGIRNPLFCELVRGHDGIEIRDDNGPVLFFINGKNYGMMNIGEKRDNTGINENNPSIKSSDVDLLVVRDDMGMRIGRNALGKGTAYIRNDAKVVYKGFFVDGAIEYEEISDSAKLNGSTVAMDDFIALDPTDGTMLDPKTFIASMAAHAIACNGDFGMNNVAYWRESPVDKKPGPFRTYTFDFDSTFGLIMWREDYDTLLDYEERTPFFTKFVSKEDYKEAFIRKIDEFLNGTFRPENAIPFVEKLEKKMDPWIEHHLKMWADGKMDKDKWKKNVAKLKEFLEVRPNYVRMHLQQYFNFNGYSKMSFSVIPEGAGTIFMDSGLFHSPLKGEGSYANIPMKIYTKAVRGYKLSHLNIGSVKAEGKIHTFDPKEGMKVEAVFVKDPAAAAADIVINEVVNSGEKKIIDEDEEGQDWIEIYNTTDRKINLRGMYLTDDEKKLDKWRFPDVSIGPEDFLVVFASGKNRAAPDNNLHTNFKLSKEPILIVDRDGRTIIDKMTQDEIKNIPKNYSGIRSPDGSSIFAVTKISTPARQNKCY